MTVAYFAPTQRRPSVAALFRIFGWRVLITVLFTIPVVAAIREPSLGWRVCLIVLAGMIASTPSAVRAFARTQRRAQEAALEAAHVQRWTQTRLEMRRIVEARASELEALRLRHRNASPAAWRKLAERFAMSVIAPEISHTVSVAERMLWLHEAVTAIDTFLAARTAPKPVRDVATLVDHCVATITAAGWESWVTPGDVVTARRAGVRVIFFCIDAGVTIDKALIDRVRARCQSAGVRYSAIIGVQPYPAGAVAYARRVRTGLIRQAHIREMLSWAVRPEVTTSVRPSS